MEKVVKPQDVVSSSSRLYDTTMERQELALWSMIEYHFEK